MEEKREKGGVGREGPLVGRGEGGVDSGRGNNGSERAWKRGGEDLFVGGVGGWGVRGCERGCVRAWVRGCVRAGRGQEGAGGEDLVVGDLLLAAPRDDGELFAPPVEGAVGAHGFPAGGEGTRAGARRGQQG